MRLHLFLLVASALLECADAARNPLVNIIKTLVGTAGKDKPTVIKTAPPAASVAPAKTNGPGSASGVPEPPNPCDVAGASCTITSPPASPTATTTGNNTCTDSACSACRLAVATFEACASAFPDFEDFTNPQAAACLCYNPSSSNSSSYIWVPNQFDVPYSACPVWAKSAAPDNASVLASFTGFCGSISNVLGVSSTDSGTIAPQAAATGGLATGTSVGSGLSSVVPTVTGTTRVSGGVKRFGLSLIPISVGITITVMLIV